MQKLTVVRSRSGRRRGGVLFQPRRLMVTVACVVAATALALAGGVASARSGAPPVLAGVWHHVFPGHLNQHIAFRGSKFLVYVHPGDAATMRTRFHGNRVTFYGSNTCPGSGTYRWSVTHGVLRFRLLGSDPCHRAQLLPHTNWKRP